MRGNTNNGRSQSHRVMCFWSRLVEVQESRFGYVAVLVDVGVGGLNRVEVESGKGLIVRAVLGKPTGLNRVEGTLRVDYS